MSKNVFCEDEKIAYYAGDDGKIFSLHKGTGRWFELKPCKTKGGYLQFIHCHKGKQKHLLVHRAVWQAFNGPVPQGLEINHKNCVRDDNRLDNLELVTRSQNLRHPPSREHCREAKRHKMKPVQDVTTGKIYESNREAARMTGLNSGSISACCSGRVHHTGGHVFRHVDSLPESELLQEPEYIELQISNYIDQIASELSGK